MQTIRVLAIAGCCSPGARQLAAFEHVDTFWAAFAPATAVLP
ncbi:MAG: hypothetical protein ACSLFB_09110 [Acidimicrobiales bacterium]